MATARYLLLEKAYMKQTPSSLCEELHPAGTEVEYAGIPGPHMDTLNDEAKAAMAEYQKNGAPLNMAAVRAVNTGVIPIYGSNVQAALTGPDRDAGMEKVLAGIDKLTGVLGGLIPPLLTKAIDGKHA